MMKRIVYAFCILALALSCTKQAGPVSEPSGRLVSMSVTCDASDSRVMLNSGLQTVWNKGDYVSVFYNGSSENTQAAFKGNDGATSGNITFQDMSGNDPGTVLGTTYAAIPYRGKNSLSAQVLHSAIPAVQYYKADSYDPESVLLVSSTTSGQLTFRYACSVLCLEVKAGGSQALTVKSITLSSAAGEAIAGDVDVDMQNPAQPAVALGEDTGASVVLCAANGADMCTIEAGGSKKFYFCAAPVALSEGYVFDVCLSDGETVRVRNTAARLLEAASLLGVECSISPSVVIIIDFDTTFSPALPGSKTTPADEGAVHTFTNASSVGGQYSITSYAEYYLTTVSGQKCFRFNKSGSNLLLPSIPGMRLRSMKAKILTNSGSKPMSIASVKNSSAGDVVPRTDFISDELTSAIAYGSVDTPLYLYTHSVNTQIESIELYFE